MVKKVVCKVKVTGEVAIKTLTKFKVKVVKWVLMCKDLMVKEKKK